ncbi:MAG: efflux RND transporter periplasmic adaptor subunit [Gammaproteobacteria bacterium]|nr:efflux RND transporter periplasmic adaptor subunit [Gammaproteobacteria bacterium]
MHTHNSNSSFSSDFPKSAGSNTYYIYAGAVLLVLFAWIGFSAFSANAAPAGGKPGGPPPMPVEVARVSQGTVNIDISAVGTLQANESLIIRPQLSGRIEAIHFNEGQAVKKGAVLFSLDASEYRAQVAESEATVKLAQLKFNRSQDLLKKNLISQQQYDEDAAKADEAAAQLALYKDRLDKTVIRAPFSGVTGLRKVSPGDVVQQGQELVSLEDINLLKLDFRAPEVYLPELKSGLDVTVVTDAFPNEIFNGKVYAIAPRVDEASRSVLLRARITNDRGVLRPGLFAKVVLRLASRENALLIPEEALWPVGNKMFVYRVVDGKAMMNPIKTGNRLKGQVEILDGLSKDDTVITAGQMKLRNEAAVMPVNQPAPDSGNVK